jgi:hypothetical protein
MSSLVYKFHYSGVDFENTAGRSVFVRKNSRIAVFGAETQSALDVHFTAFSQILCAGFAQCSPNRNVKADWIFNDRVLAKYAEIANIRTVGQGLAFWVRGQAP